MVLEDFPQVKVIRGGEGESEGKDGRLDSAVQGMSNSEAERECEIEADFALPYCCV